MKQPANAIPSTLPVPHPLQSPTRAPAHPLPSPPSSPPPLPAIVAGSHSRPPNVPPTTSDRSLATHHHCHSHCLDPRLQNIMTTIAEVPSANASNDSLVSESAGPTKGSSPNASGGGGGAAPAPLANTNSGNNVVVAGRVVNSASVGALFLPRSESTSTTNSTASAPTPATTATAASAAAQPKHQDASAAAGIAPPSTSTSSTSAGNTSHIPRRMTMSSIPSPLQSQGIPAGISGSPSTGTSGRPLTTSLSQQSLPLAQAPPTSSAKSTRDGSGWMKSIGNLGSSSASIHTQPAKHRRCTIIPRRSRSGRFGRSRCSTLADDYDLDAIVGIGSSASVYSALYKPTRRRVAVKVIDLDMFARDQIEELRKETQVMALCKHPNVLLSTPPLLPIPNSSS
ncbi:hypothetical protein BCR44DRAFT_1496113 [Catenaria anguillulae PL171]|uniref:Protein kinase domain-containing protein n=1 Tax=Catenaria anguillulae PL171 TaxID=765915 RepID=A0A1Y2I1Q3_9FUNG|nr:hypothetical protein BCR44DRAFT_1496113 [Catenaria anguillulae PL171]